MLSPKSICNNPAAVSSNMPHFNVSSSIPSMYQNISSNIDYLEEEKIEFDSPNTYISEISNISHNNFPKKNPGLKASFVLETSQYEKSKNVSPFLSENFPFKGGMIAMKNINYLENSFTHKEVNFSNEFNLPVPLNIHVKEFVYPSIKKSKRNYNSIITHFSEKADIPSTIKNKANIIPLIKNEKKYSKYKLKKKLSSQEIERMARLLANDLKQRLIF